MLCLIGKFGDQQIKRIYIFENNKNNKKMKISVHAYAASSAIYDFRFIAVSAGHSFFYLHHYRPFQSLKKFSLTGAITGIGSFWRYVGRSGKTLHSHNKVFFSDNLEQLADSLAMVDF